ncbi:MAG: hypothetical protein A2289_25085 [Deltaproteobacteria bacterium RIFOXYA12_FULL_58_15]|nr:MAG: hypothetical protein A2289_25085 [Deltaproteobacteria bacterium RIFOXYA12_FULL_58_15]OGR11001.1 MAG: hypothetical protein A2341_11475 [Deltaproteobacteria bacterium RIFOXYB12_FULL_58_9]
MAEMNVLKAIVRNGRITLDEPTELPEGEVIDLVPASDPYAYLDDNDEMDEKERAKLDKVLEESWAQARAGQTRPIEELLGELSQRG